MAGNNPPIQKDLLELGALYQRQSKFDDAEQLFEDSMLSMLEFGGELHPTTLVAMNNLGNLYEQLGLYDDAEPVLKQTLEGMETAANIRRYLEHADAYPLKWFA